MKLIHFTYIHFVDDGGALNGGMRSARLIEAEAFAETLRHGRNIRHLPYGHVHRMTCVNCRGIPFTSLPGPKHQTPLVGASVDGEFCDEPPACGVVRIADDQLTVHFNTFLHRTPPHQS